MVVLRRSITLASDGDTVTRKAVFLDLNGTLVLPVKPERLADLYAIPGAIAAVARLTAAGFVCPVITVQSRIAKGIFTASDFSSGFVTSPQWPASRALSWRVRM